MALTSTFDRWKVAYFTPAAGPGRKLDYHEFIADDKDHAHEVASQKSALYGDASVTSPFDPKGDPKLTVDIYLCGELVPNEKAS